MKGFTVGEEIYFNPLSDEGCVEGFRLEGSGEISFSDKRMRIRNTLDESLGQRANLVYWCPESFPADVVITWDFVPLCEKGLCILFFSAAGCNGEDIFDPSLAERDGRYNLYHSGDINALHISYYRRTFAQKEKLLYTCNLRKSRGFHLVAQGGDLIPSPSVIIQPYAMKIIKFGGRVEFYIEDIKIFEFEDDGISHGDILGGGKIGFRQMSPMIAEYANLRVCRALEE